MKSQSYLINRKRLSVSFLNEKAFFFLLVGISLIPLIFSKYYLTLDGPGHIYNGNIIKELLKNTYPEFSRLFTINRLPVPNWISHFLFSCCNFIFPDFISEKIVIGGYLILFAFFFRKIVLWFIPKNKVFSYLGILFAHNHLLYLGSYNLVIGIVCLFSTIYFILSCINRIHSKQIIFLALLLLIGYFSHILTYLVTIAVALALPFESLKVSRNQNKILVENWRLFIIKTKVIVVASIPSIIFAINYLIKVDSLEEAGHLSLKTLFSWLFDIRPLLTLCYCSDRYYFTRVLALLFFIMIVVNIYHLLKQNWEIKNGKLEICTPIPRFSLIWFFIFLSFSILYLVVPNANILPERLIILVFIFLILWISSQHYPRWIHRLALLIILVIHLSFTYWHTRAMRQTSSEIEMMKEITKYVEAGSLLLPFNFAYKDNWLHMHSSGYFGSGSPIVVIENYEGQLKWFPVNWNMEGDYYLDPINVWAADNKEMVKSYYSNSNNPNFFSLSQKNGQIQEIPYAVVYGRNREEDLANHYQHIKRILDQSYLLIFQNDFCSLYQLIK